MSDAPGPHDPASSNGVPATDVGPDPVWGVALGVFGLLNMAIAGALTRHWWFNFGEAFMLLGAVVFLGSVFVTNVKQKGLPSPSEMLRRVAAVFRARSSR